MHAKRKPFRHEIWWALLRSMVVCTLAQYILVLARDCLLLSSCDNDAKKTSFFFFLPFGEEKKDILNTNSTICMLKRLLLGWVTAWLAATTLYCRWTDYFFFFFSFI